MSQTLSTIINKKPEHIAKAICLLDSLLLSQSNKVSDAYITVRDTESGVMFELRVEVEDTNQYGYSNWLNTIQIDGKTKNFLRKMFSHDGTKVADLTGITYFEFCANKSDVRKTLKEIGELKVIKLSLNRNIIELFD